MGEHQPKSAVSKLDIPQPKGKVVHAPIRGTRQPKTRPLFFALIGGLVVFLGVIIAYSQLRPAQKLTVCSDVIMQDATRQHDLANLTTMSHVVDQVKAKEHYTNDPNCLYIVAEYQILTGDLKAAKATMDNIRSDYGSHKFSKSLDKGKASFASLEEQYKNMEEVQDNANGVIDPAI